MKQIFTQRAGMIGMICLLAVSLTSCLKNDDNHQYIAPKVALVSAINASPDAQPVDFFLDQNRANNFYIKSGESLDYINAYTGKRTITFYVGASNQKIISDTATFKANKLYSVFLANVVSTPNILVIPDSVGVPDEGKAGVRFVNLSPDNQALDLVVKAGATLASAKSYKQYSPFVTVNGGNTYTFEIHKAGTAMVLYTLTDVQIKNKTLNTIWVQGLSAATDSKKLTAHAQENVYYY
ncbi:DUF4397 domain-containing protein [Mucilaginibacter sp. OK283]|uniref:DUF4397 domain-containing protein n=1 Tax=Mucilaginibacter sp. OK283 TaxID=1881049 RepID=UPI0008C9D157|nr:DUF4397 domain-containing protein [Mucilaginibacter sp. OK283]SEP36499.1 protein of unknown function [Mucilaginibacter sp. OK283]